MATSKPVALVTGACAGGIGHATAVALAKLGYRVAITSINNKGLAETVRNMEKAAAALAAAAAKATTDAAVPPEDLFLALEVDFLNEQQRDQMIEKVVAKFGRLDLLVNNAGMLGRNRDIRASGFFEEFQKVIQVNLVAPTRIAELALPHLLKSKTGGVIINVSSVASHVPVKSFSYAISKAGLGMLTCQLANSLEGSNVRVLTVCPGPVPTNILADYTLDGLGKLSTTMKRSGRHEEIANVIVFLASEQASFMTGTSVDVDGGMTCKAGSLLTDACIAGLCPGANIAHAMSKFLEKL